MSLSFDNREILLPVIKPADIAEIVGIKGSKERKGEKQNFQDQDEDESYSKLIFYAHFDEDCDYILNRITNTKVSIPLNFKYQSLTDGDPLNFEDSYGRKLKNAYSVTVSRGNLKDLFETLTLENLRYYGFEFWFWSKTETCDLLKNSENSFVLAIVKNGLSFSLNHETVFKDPENKKCKFKVGKWSHILLQFSKNETGEIHFNGEKIEQFGQNFDSRKLKTERLLFLPVFEGEATEIRVWKSELDQKRKSRSHQLPLPETFEKKLGKNILFKQDRVRGKSQRSHSIIRETTQSVDSNNKGEQKRTSGLEGPKGSKTFISTVIDNNPNNPQKKMSSSVISGPSQSTSKIIGQYQSNIPKEAKKSLLPEEFNLNLIMALKPDVTSSSKNANLIKPAENSIFKDYFHLLESEEKELKENSLSDLLARRMWAQFLKIYMLKFMKFLFNDEFKEGVKTLNPYISEAINSKTELLASFVPAMVFAKLTLSCFDQIGDKFSQEAHLDFVLKQINLVNYLRLTDKLSLIILVRCLPLYIKAGNYKMCKSIVQEIEEVG